MHRYFAALAIFSILISARGTAGEISTTQNAQDLERVTRSCLRNFPAGGTATQDGFETCLRQGLDGYYRGVVKAAWGEIKTPLLATEVPQQLVQPSAPPVDRTKEEAQVRSQYRALVKSARCQRCHVGMNGSQFTLAQVHAVLNTPSHREHLGPKEVELLRQLGNLLK